MPIHRVTFPLLFCLLAAPALAQSVPPARGLRTAVAPQVAAHPPLRLAERMSTAPAVSLRSASEAAADQLAAITTWNRSGHLPVRVGFSRPLPAAERVALGSLGSRKLPARWAGGFAGRSAAGDPVWSTSISVAGAYRLRLHLAGVDLPAGTRLWVWGKSGAPHPFGLELRAPDGSLWTPGVLGDTIYLEVEAPAAAIAAGSPARFVPDAVAQRFRLDAKGQPIVVTGAELPPDQGACLIDASCVKPSLVGILPDLQKAVALLDFLDAGGEFECSGGLLNDSKSDGTPYLLTANHCFDNQEAASSLETFWDFHSSVCGGPAPDLSTVPTSSGSTLLATDPTSDFTFVRLDSVPPGRFFLGWNADPSAVHDGTHLFRVSHAFADKQVYSTSIVKSSGIPICDGAPVGDFLYAQDTSGGTFGGSSGAPSVLVGGYVVGQLLGGCGFNNPDDGCDYTNSEVDGAFSKSYPQISQWLNPTPVAACTPGPTTLCLVGGRFQVEATFDAGTGYSGQAQMVPVTDSSAYAWFFNPINMETAIKVIDGCDFNGHFWVFVGGLTNLHTVFRVTDTQTGLQRVYVNPLGNAFQSAQDIGAFSCP
jgi:lysyl endopeptidase